MSSGRLRAPLVGSRSALRSARYAVLPPSSGRPLPASSLRWRGRPLSVRARSGRPPRFQPAGPGVPRLKRRRPRRAVRGGSSSARAQRGAAPAPPLRRSGAGSAPTARLRRASAYRGGFSPPPPSGPLPPGGGLCRLWRLCPPSPPPAPGRRRRGAPAQSALRIAAMLRAEEGPAGLPALSKLAATPPKQTTHTLTAGHGVTRAGLPTLSPLGAASLEPDCLRSRRSAQHRSSRNGLARAGSATRVMLVLSLRRAIARDKTSNSARERPQPRQAYPKLRAVTSRAESEHEPRRPCASGVRRHVSCRTRARAAPPHEDSLREWRVAPPALVSLPGLSLPRRPPKRGIPGRETHRRGDGDRPRTLVGLVTWPSSPHLMLLGQSRRAPRYRYGQLSFLIPDIRQGNPWRTTPHFPGTGWGSRSSPRPPTASPGAPGFARRYAQRRERPEGRPQEAQRALYRASRLSAGPAPRSPRARAW